MRRQSVDTPMKPNRTPSSYLGETDHDSIVWDYVAVYENGKLWEKTPHEPAYAGNLVVDTIDETRIAIRQQLERKSTQR